MRIDDRIEPLVRNAIHAAVVSDLGKLEKALQAIPDDEAAQKAIELGISLIYFLMVDIHRGRPTEDEVRGIAAGVAEVEAWAEPTEEEVTTFLLHLMKGEPLAGVMSAESIIVLTFIVAANLLSSCRRDDEEWWDYLDRAEAAIEAVA